MLSPNFSLLNCIIRDFANNLQIFNYKYIMFLITNMLIIIIGKLVYS